MGGKWWKIHEDLSQNGWSWLIPRLQPAPPFPIMKTNRQDAKNAKGIEPDFELDQLAHAVIEAAIEVHRFLGPGFLESVYEEALCVELSERQVEYSRQILFKVRYKGFVVSESRLDLLIEGKLIVELKAVDAIVPIHIAQVISYLKSTGCILGLLINFNVPVLRQGVRRVISS